MRLCVLIFCILVTLNLKAQNNNYDMIARSFQMKNEMYNKSASKIKETYFELQFVYDQLLNRQTKQQLSICMKSWIDYANKVDLSINSNYEKVSDGLIGCLNSLPNAKAELVLTVELYGQRISLKDMYPTTYYNNARYKEITNTLNYIQSCNPNEIYNIARQNSVIIPD